MVVRTYGVKNAAGVSVTEEDVRGPITPGRFGTAGFVGKLEKGETGEPIIMVGPKQMKRKVGGRMDGTLVPDGIQDYWDRSNNSGLMIAVRITDGGEVKAGLTLMSRHTGVARRLSNYAKGDAERPIEPVLRIEAKNGGRWAGRFRTLTVPTVSRTADVTNVTVDFGVPMEEDELIGGYVVLEGAHSTSGKLYEIVSNTAAGVVTVRADSTMRDDIDESPAATVVATAFLMPVSLGTNKRKGLAILIKEGTLGGGFEFGMDIYLDGERVYGWDSLSMDPTSPRYAPIVINNDSGNEEIIVEDLLSPGSTITQYNRPGNFHRMVVDESATRIWFQPVVVKRNDMPDKVVVVGYEVDSGADDTITGLLTGDMVFEWDTDHYNVTFVPSERDKIAYTPLPAFTPTGALPGDYSLEYDPETLALPKITIDHMDTPDDEDQFIVQVLPVRPEVIGGTVYPNTDDNRFTGFVVRETTHDSVTVESGDPSPLIELGSVAAAQTTYEPFAITKDTNSDFRMAIDDRTEIYVNLDPAVPGAMTAAELRDQVNAAFVAEFGAGILEPASTVTDIGGTFVVFASPGGFDGVGPGSSVAVRNSFTIDGDVTPYDVLGWANPLNASQYWRGTSGTRARIEYLQEMAGGYDGLEPPLQKYMEAFSTLDSPFNKIGDMGYGNVAMATPGLPYRLSAGEVVTLYKQAFQFAESKPYAFFPETPLDKVDEADVQEYYENEVGRSDMAGTYLPSFVNVVDPDAPSKLKVVSAIPMVIGHWARVSVANSGYHIPAAGPEAVLPRVHSLPTGFERLNEEFLTPPGYNVIKRRQGDFVVWGARTLYENSLWKFMTNRLQMNHYVWTFLDNYDWVIFQLNDKITWKKIEAAAKQYLDGEWANRVLFGKSPAEAYSIKIDEDNNPQSEIDMGNAHLDLELNFTKFIERLKISVGAGGVSEAV